MLEFASLFLGLIWGVQPLEMVVGNPAIVKMEVRLDGRPVSHDRRPALAGRRSISARSRPTASRFSASTPPARRLARAEQWINMPRPPAEARLVIEEDAAGRPGTPCSNGKASTAGRRATVIVLQFDGARSCRCADPEQFDVPAGRPRAAPLPDRRADLPRRHHRPCRSLVRRPVRRLRSKPS